jgi:hypothetical protein
MSTPHTNLAERLETERQRLFSARAIVSLVITRLNAVIDGDEDELDIWDLTGELSRALRGVHELLDQVAGRLEELGKEAQT